MNKNPKKIIYLSLNIALALYISGCSAYTYNLMHDIPVKITSEQQLDKVLVECNSLYGKSPYSSYNINQERHNKCYYSAIQSYND
jgi:hypothetical protein